MSIVVKSSTKIVQLLMETLLSNQGNYAAGTPVKTRTMCATIAAP